MSRFLDTFNSKKRFRNKKQEQILKFSQELKDALGIDDMILNSMVIEGHSVEYGEYLLICSKRIFNRRWIDIIEVVPSYLGDNHGYINTQQLDGLKGWHYHMQGTATEVLPPADVRAKVIALVKEDSDSYVENTEEQTLESLKAEKELAVKNEDYERAAEIREKIKLIRK